VAPRTGCSRRSPAERHPRRASSPTTATGIPARVIEASASDTAPASVDAGFTAYGLTPSADDPLSIALHRLINEAADQAQLLEAIVAAPVGTPWRSLNARLEGPAGLQLTLFEELDAVT